MDISYRHHVVILTFDLYTDYERVIRHHIQNEDYTAVLGVLRKPTNSAALFYKFSPVLMQHIPHDLVSAWIEQGKALEAKKLIPSLVQCDSGPSEMQVRKGCVVLLW